MKAMYLLFTSFLIIALLILFICCFYPPIEIEPSPVIFHNVINLTGELDDSSSHPSVIRDNNGWALAFEYEDTEGNHSVYFLRCNSEGVLTDEPTRITDNTEKAYTPVIGGGENTYGLAYIKETDEGRQIYFRVYNAGNENLSEEKKISSVTDSDCYSPALFFWQPDDNAYYGIVWCCEVNSNYSLYFTGGDETEINNSTAVQIPNSAINAQTPRLIRDNENYILAWADRIDQPDNSIYFQRITNSGGLFDSLPLRVSPDNQRAEHPSCAWNKDSDEYGIAWHNESQDHSGYYHINFCRVDDNGQVKQDSKKLITIENTFDAKFPSLVRNENDDEYRLAWMDNSRTGSFEIMYCTLDAEGAVKAGPYIIFNENISESTESSGFPQLLWNEEEYAIIWTVTEDDKTNIYYAY